MPGKNSLLKNILSLTFAEGISKLLMYFYMAYLARVIGTKGIGAIGLGQSIVLFTFVSLIVGLDGIGVREVAKNRDNYSEQVNSIFTFRILLSFLVFGLVTIYIVFAEPNYETRLILIVVSAIIFGYGGMLNWVYLGIEKVNVIVHRTIFTSLLNLAGILLFVKNQNDTLIAATIITATQIINMLLMIWVFIKNEATIHFKLDPVILKPFLYAVLPLSLSFVFVYLNQNLAIISTSFYLPQTYLHENGVFFTAFRFYTMAIVPVTIFQNSFFSKMSGALSHEARQAIFDKYSKLIYFSAIPIFLMIFIFSDILITILWGNQFHESIIVLKVLAVAILFAFFNVAYNTPLIAWNYERKVLLTFLISSLTSIITIPLLLPKYGALGAAIILCICEIFICLGLFYNISKIKINTNLLYLSKVILINGIAALPFLCLYSFQIQMLYGLPVYLVILLLLSHYLQLVNFDELKASLIRS